MNPIIIPAILTNNFKDLENKIKYYQAFFPTVQIDVMDGILVENKSFEEVDKINEIKNLPNLELHLMVESPLQELEKWEKIKNIKKITFHIESKDDPKEVYYKISGMCGRVGLALNPSTPLEKIEPYLDLVSEILFLMVEPGKQGNTFQPQVMEKIKTLAKKKLKIIISADGGINENNIKELKKSGVNIFYIGSTLNKSKNITETIANLKTNLL